MSRTPLFVRLLRLRHLRLTGLQRSALADGPLLLAVLLALADLASAWVLVALPVGVAVLVKAHDVLAGLLREPGPAPARPDRPRP